MNLTSRKVKIYY